MRVRARAVWMALAILAAVGCMALVPSRQARAGGPTPIYPIVFVPGTAASYLQAPGTGWVYWFSLGQLLTNQLGGNCGSTIMLMPCVGQINPTSDLNKLALNPDGSDTAPVQVGDIFRQLDMGGQWGPGVQDVYQTMLADLAANDDYREGGGPDNWLYVAPYDWRKSPAYNARTYVLPKVEQALADHPGTKVVLLAHSQGGLVARSFIAGEYTDAAGHTFRCADKVAAMIAIATPWLGTPRVTQAISVGWDFGIPGLSTQWGPKLAPNWPAVYAMMPSNDQYFADYPGGYYYQGAGAQGGKYGEPPLPEDEQNSIISEQNTQAGGDLMAQAMQWRAQDLDGESLGVQNFLIAGYIKPGTAGQQIPLGNLGEDPTDTILRVVRYAGQGYHCLFWHCWTFSDEQDYVDVGAGDNTIPLASALAWSPSNGPLPAWPGGYGTETQARTVSQSVIGPYTYYIVTDKDGNGTSARHNAKHMHLPDNVLVDQTIGSIVQNLVTIMSPGTLPAGTLGQPYSVQLSAIGGDGQYTWSSSQDLSPYGLTLDPSGLLHGKIQASPIAVSVTATDAQNRQASAELSIPVQFPAMSMDPMPPTDAGQYYDHVVQASGGVAPLVTAQTGLPAWLGVQCFVIGTCEFKGTPPGPGTYPFRLQLTDQGPGTQIWQDEVLTVNPAPVITTQTTTIDLAPGQLLEKQFQAQGGARPYTWAVLNGPSWLGVSADGLLSGTPPACGNWTPTVDMQDAVGVQVPAYLTVTVAGGTPAIVDASPPDATVGQSYAGYNLSALGGCGPYTWAISAGSLPPGLALDPSTGEIRGTVTTAGTFTFTAAVTDHSNPPQTATQQFQIDAAAPLSLVTGSLPPGSAGQAYSASLQAAGGYTPYHWSVGRMCVAHCPRQPGLGRGQQYQAGLGIATPPPVSSGPAVAFASEATPPPLTVAATVFAPSPAAEPVAMLTPVYSVPLPAGLTLDPNSGTISGTPQQAGTYQLDLLVTDNHGQVAAGLFTLAIAGAAATPAAPAITALSPFGGPAAGGNQVTITGTGLGGATAVSFGAAAGTGLQVQGDTALTVTAPAGTGSVGVTVTTPAGTSAPANYTYQPAPVAGPAVTAISPASGPDAGGQTVTLTGSALAGATAVQFGAFGQGQDIQASADGTSLTVVTPADWWGDGPVDVTVATAAGTSAPVTFTYGAASTGPVTGSGPAAPVVTAISPASGSDGGGQTVTLTGSGLAGATAVSFGDFGQGQDIQVGAGGTSLTVQTPAAWWGDGQVEVVVTTPAGSSSGTPYTYTAGTATGGSTGTATQNPGTPTVTGITPASGPDTGGQTVTITGTGLAGATAVQFGQFGQGQDIQVSPAGTSLTVQSPQAWWGDGQVQVVVTTPAGSSSGTAYTYTSGTATGGSTGGTPTQHAGAPTVTGITPASGPDAGGQTVTITGTGLTGATAVQFGDFGQGQNIQVSADGTSLTVVTPQAWWGDGPVFVQVTTAAGAGSGSALYTFVPGSAAGGASTQGGQSAGGTSTQGGSAGPSAPPVITAITPATGPDAGGQTVTISGTGLQGATQVQFGDFGQGQDIQASADGTSLTVVTPEDWWGDGPVYVEVTTPAGTSSGSVQYTYAAA